MRKILTVVAAGAIILLLLSYLFYFRPNYYLFNGGKIEFTPEIRQELHRGQYMKVLPYEDSIYYCSVEGMEKKSLDGTSEWTKPFQMVSPLLKRAGDYFVVADIMGHDAHIFHKNGHTGSIRESLPIISVSINREGQVVLVLESDLENKIKIYSNDGLALIERGSVLSQDGYPISTALSDNGLNLVTSYADVLTGSLTSKITMFGFADFQDDLDEFVVRADSYEGELVPELHYFENRTLWMIGTKNAYIYPMVNQKEVYQNPTKIEISGDVVSVDYTEDEVLLFVDSKENIDNRYRLLVYRLDGQLVNELFFTDYPALIQAGKDHYFVVTESKVKKYKKAKMVWEYPFHEIVDSFYEIDSEQYLLVQPMGYTVLKVKEIY